MFHTLGKTSCCPLTDLNPNTSHCRWQGRDASFNNYFMFNDVLTAVLYLLTSNVQEIDKLLRVQEILFLILFLEVVPIHLTRVSPG